MPSDLCVVLNNQHQRRVDDFVQRCSTPEARMLFQPYAENHLKSVHELSESGRLPLPIFLISGRMGAEAAVVGDLVKVEYREEVPKRLLNSLLELLPVTDDRIYGTNLLYLANARPLTKPVALEEFRKTSNGRPLRRGRWPAVISYLPKTSSPTEKMSNESVNETEEAVEGYIRILLRKHRQRERNLRTTKIRSTLRANGRLVCEVAACRFDFERVYGEMGREYAHVHHLRPLAEIEASRKTTLNDLAIVCPNCHAMIHRGGLCRPLDEVSTSIRRGSE
jgi:HNH endonuclease